MSPGPLQILLIIILILLLFGANRVPGIMENLAKGMKSFKQGLKDDEKSPKKIDHHDTHPNE
ncbi:MAG: twin-arginine translocase TatA/TatE family subunit [Alphaproteobacteria bacterium]